MFISKNFDTLRRISYFLTGNVISQALSAVCGLLLARWMSISDYGFYTIVMVMIGAISVISKGGVHLGFTAILGRTWPDKRRAHQALNAMLSVRRRLSLITLPILLTISGAIVWKAGGDLVLIAIILIGLFSLWKADMSTAIIDQVLFFSKQSTKVQQLDTRLSILRLLFITLLFYVGGLNIYTVLFATVLVAYFRIKPITLWVKEILHDGASEINQDDEKEISLSVKKQLPVEIFYVLQAQIVLFVLTLYGKTDDLAGYGAISRLAQLFLPLQSLTYAFLIPYFAQAENQIIKKLFVLTTLLSIPGAALVTLAWLKPELLLLLIGDHYANMKAEVLVACIVFSLIAIIGNAWRLVANRGLVHWSWIQIPIGLLWCFIAPALIDLHSVRGALMLQGGFSIGLLVAIMCELTFEKKHRLN